MPLHNSATTVARQQLLDRVQSLVEQARKKGSEVSAGVEAERLISEYPNCPMSFAELSEAIASVAGKDPGKKSARSGRPTSRT